ncbi:MAG TPA: hypothetical protein VK470_10875 [Bacteroidota bacterium]|nr:hypothetical protein [Bacteroidota bacterium]
MSDSPVHSFHIPVLGLAFSIDTPLRVGRFGISSVVSIVDDILIEHMRKHYASVFGEEFTPISPKEEDARARRITEYLNLLHRQLQKQIAELRQSAFESKGEIVKYFEMLAETSPLKALYERMKHAADAWEKKRLQEELRTTIVAGAIDVNIMTKLDKVNFASDGTQLSNDYTDAVAALRGFVRSDLESSVVLSAGLNPRLFSYMGQCPEFLPDNEGRLHKKVILKVSDFRSALIQGKILAKKGIWISEFRIESGLNCGGHAFATEGMLLGPILEEFKNRREELAQELFGLYTAALKEKGVASPVTPFLQRVTVQGGIGTANEDAFLREYHKVDGTGWGSPFLLVPEATNVDDQTRQILQQAKQEDFYLSDASPLGVPFNNLRGSTSHQLISERVEDGRSGFPCTKKFLVSNTEFTEAPICTASRKYQALKIKQLESSGLSEEHVARAVDKLQEKACLCEHLASPGIINSDEYDEETPLAVAVCPGPNLAYFSKIATLEEMVSHIYGRINLLTSDDRPNMFINELRLYIDYLKHEIEKQLGLITAKEQKYFTSFKSNMIEGIAYYKSLVPNLARETELYRETMKRQLQALEEELVNIIVPKIEA